MTDHAVHDIFGSLPLMFDFMVAEHADPVDRLVARALRLRWDAYATHYMLPKPSTASEIALHTRMFGDVVLVEVQKQKHYDVVEFIVETIRAEHGIFFEALGMNSSPNVTENVAHYDAMLDLCEKVLGSEAVKGAIPKWENAFYGTDDFGFGAMEHASVVSHELMPHRHESANLHYHVWESSTLDELPPYDLDMMFIVASNPEAYADFMDGDADRARFLDRLRSVPFPSYAEFSIGKASSEACVDGRTALSDATNEFAGLEQLVAVHVKKNPDLLKNVLFWKLVEQCADTIAYATNAGKELDFITSHSGFGGPRNAVFLMIADVPFGISIDDDLDVPKFKVVRQGIRDSSIKTGANLLDLVKKSIG